MHVRHSDGPRLGPLIVLAGAHFLHDVMTAFLAPLLPLLIAKHGLSYFFASLLDFFHRLPSLFNPLLGAAIDRSGTAKLAVAVCPGAAAVTMCLLGIAPTYSYLVLLLLTGGVAVAALHVSTPALVAEVAGRRVGLGMSLFMVGGELARTVGPLIAVPALLGLGLEGLWQLIPVALLGSVLLGWQLRTLPASVPSATTKAFGPFISVARVWKRMHRLLLLVAGIMTARAFLSTAPVLFLPTLLSAEGKSFWIANGALAVFQLGGACGTLLGGLLSDRLGRVRVLAATVTSAPLLMVLFLLAPNGWQLAVLALLGFAALATTPVLMAVTLEHAGQDRAVANGSFMLVSFAVRSTVVMLVGVLGDYLGMRWAFFIGAILATLGLPLVVLLRYELRAA